MTRRLYRVAAWLTLLAVFAGGVYVATHALRQQVRTPAGATSSLAYAIRTGQSIDFALNAPDRQVRLLTNVALSAAAAPDAAKRHVYALDYALLGDGEVLKQGRHWLRGNSEFVIDADGQRLPLNRYSGAGELRVLSTQVGFLDYADVAAADTLRLTLAETGPGIAEVAVRVYAHQPIPEARVASTWLRMSAAQQTELAGRTTYGPELLDAQEKANLVRNRWRPLGPRGAAGDQYVDRRLLSVDTGSADRVRDAIMPAGIVMDARRRAVIVVPPGPGEVELVLERFSPPSPAAAAPEPAPVIARWFGARPGERAQLEIPAAPRPQAFRHAWAPGLIELEAREPLVVRAWRVAGERREPLTDVRQQLRLFRLDPQAPLEYEIAHDGDRATPLRLDLRRVFDAGGAAPSALPAVHYALLDGSGGVIGEGELALPAQPSLYEQLASEPGGGRVSEPVRQFFALPPAVRRLRLLGDASVHAVAYTRPDDLPYARVLPEDLQPWRPLFDVAPAWFLLPPRDADGRVREASTALVEWQRRPPEWTAEAPLAGAWRDFNPEGGWSGRSVLVEQPASGEVVESALASRYRAIARDTAQDLLFRAADRGLAFTPDLIAVETRARERVRVYWDGQLVHDGLSGGEAVRIPLPEARAGRHRLRVEAASGRWFVNHVGDASSRHLLRFAARLAPGATLRYALDKTVDTAEPLSAQVFAAPGARLQLRTRLHGLDRIAGRPLPDWTHAERRFDVQGLDGLPGWLMQERAPRIEGSPYLLMPLNGDLPRGRYALDLRNDGASEAYVLLYRVGGAAEPVRVIRARARGESRD